MSEFMIPVEITVGKQPVGRVTARFGIVTETVLDRMSHNMTVAFELKDINEIAKALRGGELPSFLRAIADEIEANDNE